MIEVPEESHGQGVRALAWNRKVNPIPVMQTKLTHKRGENSVGFQV